MKRVLSILLALTLVLGLIPLSAIPVAADYEDGNECWLCDHYHWDAYMCGSCGACSAECTSVDCYIASHCNECGACLKEASNFCAECRTCEDCYVSNGWHCLGCGECYFTDEESLCGLCWFCESCLGPHCNECGFCESCQELDGGVHCPECYNCYNVTESCVDGKEHCIECCVICESCEACLYEEGVDLCDTCQLCPDCCLEQAEAMECDCGEFCVESSDWYEHLCPDCGIPFCQIEPCDLCGLCSDCCGDMSDCPEGMCILDDEYDFHFCEDCGECAHNVDLCESCGDAGELRCADCCAVLTEEQGCDCGDRCFNEWDFESHLLQEHGPGTDKPHDPTPKSDWLMDSAGHWHECRYCDEHSYLNFESHNLNKYGVCSVCSYDIYAKILILKQPKSRVARLTDYGAEEGEPFNYEDNTVHFNIAATGHTALTYQWQVKYDDGKWINLTDETDTWWDSGHTYYTVHGAKTPNLTVSVSPEACYTTLYYRCIVTDEEDNREESAIAALRCAHVYRGKYVPNVSSELLNIIFQENGADNIGVYETVSHNVYCMGDSCESYKEEPHHFSKVTKTYVNKGTNAYGQPVGDGSLWTEYTCLDCGVKKYEKYHDHYFIDPETGDCEVDYSYENKTQHQIKCLYPGCQKTTRESHAWMGWQHMGTPHTTDNGKGIAYRECRVCSYQNTSKPEQYDTAQDQMIKADWTKNNDLLVVQYGAASTDLTWTRKKFYITFTPTAYDKKNSIGKENPRCITWDTYYTYETALGNPVTIDVSDDVSLVLQDDGPKWRVEIYDFAQHIGGGIFTFVPVISKTECAHDRGTYVKGAYDPICVKDGYTGDKVCKDCGHVVTYGDAIDAPGEHQGELVLNPLTVRQGTCDHRGYSGTSRCTHCGLAVRGKSTPKVHTGQVTLENYVAPTCGEFGYSGDAYCDCGVLLKAGTMLAPEHANVTVVGYRAPTTQAKGYSGDLVCDDCGVTLKYGYDIRNDRLVTHIVINDLDQPIAGQTPDYTVALGDGYKLDVGATLYRKNGIMWKRFNYDDPMHVNSTFIAGGSYRCYITLEVEGVKQFAGDVTATVNGQPATVTFLSDSRYVVVEYEFSQIPEAYIRQVNLTGVTEPREGGYPTWNVTLDSPLYYVDEFSWAENDEYFSEYDSFTAGKQYSVGMVLYTTIIEGHFQCEFDENVQVTVNGKPATVLSVDYDYAYNGSSVYFVWDCPPVKENVRLVKQPTSVEVAKGKTASVSVTATGDDLTYTWFYKNKGAAEFAKTDSFTGPTYSVEMNASRDGRQVYCVIADGNGNFVITDTVTLSMKKAAVTITTQPKTTYAKEGATAKLTVEASGDGLKYQWYIKNAGGTKYSKSSVTAKTYSVTMSEKVHDRRLYCVITDRYGNEVRTETVLIRRQATIIKEPATAAYAKMGAKVSVKITALGDGLTYTWYIKNNGKTSYSKSSVKSATYSTTMSSTAKGRMIYCVVKDKYGKSVQSKTFTLRESVSVTTQPKTAYAKKGATIKTTVKASGDGLTYTWYIKNDGKTSYSKSSIKTATYSTTMSSTTKNRQVYCVVKDKWGKTVTTSKVYLREAVSITTQPKTVTVKKNATAKVTVKASGDGLTYTWYFKNEGQTKYSKSSVTKATYSTTMDSKSKNRLLYCVVTDQYGNTVKTSTVRLKMK